MHIGITMVDRGIRCLFSYGIQQNIMLYVFHSRKCANVAENELIKKETVLNALNINLNMAMVSTFCRCVPPSKCVHVLNNQIAFKWKK